MLTGTKTQVTLLAIWEFWVILEVGHGCLWDFYPLFFQKKVLKNAMECVKAPTFLGRINHSRLRILVAVA